MKQRSEFLAEQVADAFVEPVTSRRRKIGDPFVATLQKKIQKIPDPLDHVEINVVDFRDAVTGVRRNKWNMLLLQNIGNFIGQR